MQPLKHSIEINASKENVWETLFNDKDFRDWANIIDPGTYMVGSIEEGNEVNFLSASGYGVASKIEKMIPYKFITFIWTSDVKIAEDGSLEKRDPQWTGGKETYEIAASKEGEARTNGREEKDGKVTLTLTQEIPDELVDTFKDRVPKALERVKVLAEMKNL